MFMIPTPGECWRWWGGERGDLVLDADVLVVPLLVLPVQREGRPVAVRRRLRWGRSEALGHQSVTLEVGGCWGTQWVSTAIQPETLELTKT